MLWVADGPAAALSCGGTLEIIALIDRSRQPEVVEKILRHCGLCAPPATPLVVPKARELTSDFGYTSTVLSASFDKECA